ncbi:MAG: insulinase family protein [Alphaproteobacteria bacterium]|nr:MAG: insulinase family protein [Alphaproteobacteria bacterium]
MTYSSRSLLSVLGFLFISLVSLPVHAADIQEVTSSGGIKAWLVEEHSIPIVSLNVAWRAGSSFDPKGKGGLAHFAASTMDEGSADLDSKAFQEKLSDLAIQLGFDVGKDSFSGSLKTLSENTNEAFQLFGNAITQPRFDKEPVERIRGQILNSLNQRLSNPNSLAGRGWFRLAFGDQAYSRPSNGTIKTIAAVTHDDLVNFAKTRLGKDNMVIGVVGDITAKDLSALLDKTFGGLPEKADLPTMPPQYLLDEAAVKIIPQDIPQSIVTFGGQGVTRDDPDYYAAYVLNYILGGGGFESRLTDEIREKRGLVYSIYSYLYPMDEIGLQMGGFGTSNASVKEALDLTRGVIAKIRDEGVTDEELEGAKTYLNGSFPLSLSSNDSIANILVAMQRSHLPIGYLDQRASLINAVTKDDIKRVAQRLLDPEKLIVVVVGKPVDLKPVGAGAEKS